MVQLWNKLMNQRDFSIIIAFGWLWLAQTNNFETNLMILIGLHLWTLYLGAVFFFFCSLYDCSYAYTNANHVA